MVKNFIKNHLVIISFHIAQNIIVQKITMFVAIMISLMLEFTFFGKLLHLATPISVFIVSHHII
jgi:hypothetical protein